MYPSGPDHCLPYYRLPLPPPSKMFPKSRHPLQLRRNGALQHSQPLYHQLQPPPQYSDTATSRGDVSRTEGVTYDVDNRARLERVENQLASLRSMVRGVMDGSGSIRSSVSSVGSMASTLTQATDIPMSHDRQLTLLRLHATCRMFREELAILRRIAENNATQARRITAANAARLTALCDAARTTALPQPLQMLYLESQRSRAHLLVELAQLEEAVVNTDSGSGDIPELRQRLEVARHARMTNAARVSELTERLSRTLADTETRRRCDRLDAAIEMLTQHTNGLPALQLGEAGRASDAQLAAADYDYLEDLEVAPLAEPEVAVDPELEIPDYDYLEDWDLSCESADVFARRLNNIRNNSRPSQAISLPRLYPLPDSVGVTIPSSTTTRRRQLDINLSDQTTTHLNGPEPAVPNWSTEQTPYSNMTVFTSVERQQQRGGTRSATASPFSTAGGSAPWRIFPEEEPTRGEAISPAELAARNTRVGAIPSFARHRARSPYNVGQQLTREGLSSPSIPQRTSSRDYDIQEHSVGGRRPVERVPVRSGSLSPAPFTSRDRDLFKTTNGERASFSTAARETLRVQEMLVKQLECQMAEANELRTQHHHTDRPNTSPDNQPNTSSDNQPNTSPDEGLSVSEGNTSPLQQMTGDEDAEFSNRVAAGRAEMIV